MATARRFLIFGRRATVVCLPPGGQASPANPRLRVIAASPSVTALPSVGGARRVIAKDCPALSELPASLDLLELDLSRSGIVELPPGIRVAFRLDLTGCQRLTKLPDDLTVGTLIVRDCFALERLPERLSCSFLDLSGCSNITELPGSLQVRGGRLRAAGLRRVQRLPSGLGPLAQLDVSGCEALRELPDDLDVRSWVDVAGSGLTALGRRSAQAALRWRGVRIDERIAFRPHELTAAEALAETNAERRRVLIERIGFAKFFAAAGAQVLDRDRDAGGPRELVTVDLAGDEKIVCLSVSCPSTGRKYLLRVPPGTPTCSRAAAWLAGFDDPSAYQPSLET
jgi:hypothetical protein